MSVHRYPIERDDLANLLRTALEDWHSGGGQFFDPTDLDIAVYDQQAAAVLDLLRKLRLGVDPVGVKEIADRADTTRKGVDTWRERYGPGHASEFPAARWLVGGRPAWDWCDIEEWGEATGRLRSGRWGPVGEYRTAASP